MSSSEEENFDIQDVSGSESDDYAPAVKKKAPVRPLLVLLRVARAYDVFLLLDQGRTESSCEAQGHQAGTEGQGRAKEESFT